MVEHAAAHINQLLVEAQEMRGKAALALAGGPWVLATVQALAASTRTAQFVPDWSRVDLWWCDELFIPHEDEQRNSQRAARAAEHFMLVSVIAPENIHVMGGSDQFVTAEQAAEDYLAELKAAADAEGTGGDFPTIDVALLGLDPSSDLADPWPETTHTTAQEATVVAVPPSPERGHERIIMTAELICTAEHLVHIVADVNHTETVQQSPSGAHHGDGPGRAVTGRVSTVLFTTVGGIGSHSRLS